MIDIGEPNSLWMVSTAVVILNVIKKKKNRLRKPREASQEAAPLLNHCISSCL